MRSLCPKRCIRIFGYKKVPPQKIDRIIGDEIVSFQNVEIHLWR